MFYWLSAEEAICQETQVRFDRLGTKKSTDPIRYYRPSPVLLEFSSGNLAVLTNARLKPLALRPCLSAGLPLSDFRKVLYADLWG